MQRIFIAIGKVHVVALLNIASKILLVIGMLSVISFSGSLYGVASVHVLTELFGFGVMLYLCGKMGGIHLRFDVPVAGSMLKIGLPFCLVIALNSLYTEGNTMMMAAFASEREIGLYGTAYRLVAVLLLALPILQSGVTPVLSKSLAAKDGSFQRVIAQTLRFLLIISLPITTFLMFFGDLIAALLFGPDFADANRIIVASGPLLAVIYLTSFLGAALGLITTGQKLSLVYVGAIAVNLVLGRALIPGGLALFGGGGAGVAVALSTACSELVILLGMNRLFDFRPVERSLLWGLLALALPAWLATLFYEHVHALSLGQRVGLFLTTPIYGVMCGLIRPCDFERIAAEFRLRFFKYMNAK
jgi:O-antigen/teichoic acid export membrane protein